MALPIENILNDVLSDLNNLTPEKIQGLLQEAVKTFTSLKEKANSTDAKERTEAYNTALKLRETIEIQTAALGKKLGLEPEQLATLAESAMSSPNEWIEMSSAKNELEEFYTQMGYKPKKTSSSPKRKKTPWLPG